MSVPWGLINANLEPGQDPDDLFYVLDKFLDLLEESEACRLFDGFVAVPRQCS